MVREDNNKNNVTSSNNDNNNNNNNSNNNNNNLMIMIRVPFKQREQPPATTISYAPLGSAARRRGGRGRAAPEKASATFRRAGGALLSLNLPIWDCFLEQKTVGTGNSGTD